MKETQLLLKGPLVIATLAELKRMTRRLRGLEHVNENPDAWKVIRRMQKEEPTSDGGIQGFPGASADSWLALKNPAGVEDDGFLCLRCPYGDVGDRLWVRESFSYTHGCEVSDVGTPIWYWADGNPQHGDWTRPKPSIHMPRWACRLVLEIVSVRVERLQDISTKDALAEGAASAGTYLAESFDPIDWFETLWKSINGAESWSANPWGWVVEFKKVAA